MRRRINGLVFITFCILLTTNYTMAQEGRIVRETIYSPSLEGNLLGDSPNRPVTIYLPPSYDTDPEKVYPVVYLLHGYTGNNELWTGGSYIRNGNIKDWMDMWLEEGKVKEMILVMPNSYNKYKGSYYTNSIATGRWADFIAKDLVKYIDSHYRTLAQRESRSVAGHSMGGMGALLFGIYYPDVFSGIGLMAGTDSGNPEEMLNTYRFNFANASTIKNWAEYSSLDWLTQVMFAWASAFAPNPDKPPFYCDFPFVYTDTEPREIVKVNDIYKKMLQKDPMVVLENRTEALRSMKAIYIDCGTNDWPAIQGSRILNDRLNSLGIKHFYKEFSGDHTCCVMNSTGDALEVFSKVMAYEMLVNVEPIGKMAVIWGQIRSSSVDFCSSHSLK